MKDKEKLNWNSGIAEKAKNKQKTVKSNVI